MENPPKKFIFTVKIFLLIAFSQMLNSKFVDGRISSTSTIKNYTIESEDGSYVIECVDIYKQPAFSHPLLNNHSIQKRPSSSPNGLIKRNKKDQVFIQSWNKYGKCPKDTIPIARTQFFKHKKTSGSFPNGTQYPLQTTAPVHEYVAVSTNGGPYYGARASLNIWNPSTFNGEFSLSQFWVEGSPGPYRNTLEAGWQVYPSRSGSNKPRLFIYWTRDNYQSTGCYNLNCPGFVQTNNKIAFGTDLSPISIYGEKQFQIQLTIHKDKSSGNWWLRLGQEDLGYWPKNILTTLAESSNSITWGGEITNTRTNGKHTSTQMGSGHFSSEGYGKAAYVANFGYIDNFGATIIPDPRTLKRIVTNYACYDLKFGDIGTELGLHFYFGGPGFSPQCQ